jgi:hypothetical protein
MNDRSRELRFALAGSECIRDRCGAANRKTDPIFSSRIVRISLYCSFVTSPYAQVCAGFASDYSWSGSI